MAGNDGDTNLAEGERDNDPQAAEGFAEAERRIAEALRTGATELNLSKLGLTALPESLGQLGSLEEIHLDC